MSVTVADCLELPSLRDATVIGGSDGLDRIVTAVSVLEYSDASMLADDLFIGNELLITAFITVKDDVEKQSQTIRCLCDRGVVGVALYYVGVFLPEIDKRLIDLANELNFPLIVMPRDRLDYRYGEVIGEVMESIFLDQMQETYFVPAILERVAQYPERHRTISNLLRIISDRLRCTLVVTDNDMEMIGSAAWPMSATLDYEQFIECCRGKLAEPQPEIYFDIHVEDLDMTVLHGNIQIGGMSKMYLFVVKVANAQSKSFNEYTVQQISELIHLFMGINQYSYAPQNSDALIKAVLDDDQHLINRIASHTNIDMKSLQSMCVLIHLDSDEKNRQQIDFLNANRAICAKTFLKERYKSVFVEVYEKNLVVFMGNPLLADSGDTMPEEFMNTVCENDGRTILIWCTELANRIEVREAYYGVQNYWYTLTTIYPTQLIFNRHELNFAKTCKMIMQRGGEEINPYLAYLDPLISPEHSDEFLKTLSVFLLDTGNSVNDTGKRMFVHPSTVKYRLKVIKQRIGRDITKMPDAYDLYLACALYRLYEQA